MSPRRFVNPCGFVRPRRLLEYAANRLARPLGYELHDRVLSERPEGFPGYLEAASAAGLDVNDYEEQCLGWRLPRPTLDEVAFPYINEHAVVYELGPGTGRWSRHLLPRIPQGWLYLVDPSPWIVRFLAQYFQHYPNVQACLNDGQSLGFAPDASIDLIFSANTFVELKLGVIYAYVAEFGRTLKPGGYAVVDYIDPTTPEGWQHLLTQGLEMAGVYTFHAAEVIDHVFGTAGLSIERRYQVGKSTFVVARHA